MLVIKLKLSKDVIASFYTIDLHNDNTNTKRFTKLTYNRALPDIWRSDRGNEKKVKKKKKNTYIHVYINNVYNLI